MRRRAVRGNDVGRTSLRKTVFAITRLRSNLRRATILCNSTPLIPSASYPIKRVEHSNQRKVTLKAAAIVSSTAIYMPAKHLAIQSTVQTTHERSMDALRDHALEASKDMANSDIHREIYSTVLSHWSVEPRSRFDWWQTKW